MLAVIVTYHLPHSSEHLRQCTDATAKVLFETALFYAVLLFYLIAGRLNFPLMWFLQPCWSEFIQLEGGFTSKENNKQWKADEKQTFWSTRRKEKGKRNKKNERTGKEEHNRKRKGEETYSKKQTQRDQSLSWIPAAHTDTDVRERRISKRGRWECAMFWFSNLLPITVRKSATNKSILSRLQSVSKKIYAKSDFHFGVCRVSERFAF